MNDFRKRFQEERDDFDKQFEKSKRVMAVAVVIQAILALAGAAFAIWVIIKVMSFFGVI